MKNSIKLPYYGFLFISSIFASCHTDNTTNQTSSSHLTYQVDSISIPLDTLSLPRYDFFHHYKDTLFAYNLSTHSMDIFSLSSKKILRHVILDREGSNGVGQIEGLYVHRPDSVFVYANKKLYVLDDQGKIRQSISLVRSLDYQKFGSLAANLHFRLQYDAKRKTVFLLSIYAPGNYNNPFISTLNLNSEEFSQLPINYSDYYINNQGNVGYLAYPNKDLIYHDLLVYNFLYESNIYTYDLKNRKKSVYKAESRFSPSYASIFSIKNQNPDDWSKHSLENPHYFHVLYDPYRQLYYRFHWGQVSYQTTHGQTSTFLDKELFLMVFDERFNILKEIKLPKDIFIIHSWFVGKEGLYVSPTHPKNKNQEEDKLNFQIFKFEKNI